MTAEHAGKAAAQGIWATLKTVKDQWILVVFVAGALFWARDRWEELQALPAALAAQAAAIEALDHRLGALERGGSDGGAGRGRGDPVLAFPGRRHSASDAMPGGWSDIRLDPVLAAAGCHATRLDAFVVDAAGRWFQTVATLDVAPLPEAGTALGFAVRVPEAVPPGRASVALRFAARCGEWQGPVEAPVLPFTVADG